MTLWRTPGHDKLCHIRPILDDILQKCTNNYNPHREQSVDEGMIAYKGRLSFKQYLPAKPTKLGIKIWERALPQNGYCHEFQIYTGKVDSGATEEGLGAIVVQNLGRKINKKGHHVHMDNFFSLRFSTDLYAEEVYCCGTVNFLPSPRRWSNAAAITGFKNLYFCVACSFSLLRLLDFKNSPLPY